MPNQEALCELILHNPTDYPIEIYSMELDKHYLEEEQMLRKYDGYENGLAELPVRSAGAGCWSEVVQRVEEIKAAEEPPPEDEAEGSDGLRWHLEMNPCPSLVSDQDNDIYEHIHILSLLCASSCTHTACV
eukprot:636545-Amphidinium_carterae.1